MCPNSLFNQLYLQPTLLLSQLINYLPILLRESVAFLHFYSPHHGTAVANLLNWQQKSTVYVCDCLLNSSYCCICCPQATCCPLLTLCFDFWQSQVQVNSRFDALNFYFRLLVAMKFYATFVLCTFRKLFLFHK